MAIKGEWRPLTELQSIPAVAGVYELGSIGGSVIFIGSAANLHDAIAQHAAAPIDTCIGRYAVQYRYLVTENCAVQEQELLREYQLTHDERLPRCNAEIMSALERV